MMTEPAVTGPQKSTDRRLSLAEPGIRVTPSVLAADFCDLGSAVGCVEEAGASILHLDVMDGHFVPNISFGAPVVASLRKRTRMYFDTHLMIQEPQRYAESFVCAGSDHITFHIEVADDPQSVIKHIRSLGVTVGVSMNPATEVAAVEPVLDQVDMVLVMSVWPGFGGQSFMEEVLSKVEALRGRLGTHQRLQIDGGVDTKTIGRAAAAGADTFVAGTAVFASPDPAWAYQNLLRLAGEATSLRRCP